MAQAVARTKPKTSKIIQPLPKQPIPFCGGGGSIQVLAMALVFFHVDLSLSLDQLIVQTAQPFRNHARATKYGHEVRVPVPPRHNVQMQMIDHAGARALAEV